MKSYRGPDSSPSLRDTASQRPSRRLWPARRTSLLAAAPLLGFLGCGLVGCGASDSPPVARSQGPADPAAEVATEVAVAQTPIVVPIDDVAEENASPAPVTATNSQAADQRTDPPQPKPPKPLPPPTGAERLSPEHAIWISTERGEVIIDGLVSQRQAVLEMFACTRNTKEHESIISADTMAFVAHAALLRLGAEPGSPVQFEPEYAPPKGTEIEIQLKWRDTSGKMQQARAQEWIRDMRTGKPMTQPFVFGGSGMWKDEQSGKEFYMAEGGDFICVSNFSTAMLDVPAKSTQANEGLLFEAYTERIPPLGTPVRMLLKPLLKKKSDPAQDQPSADKSTDNSPGETADKPDEKGDEQDEVASPEKDSPK